VTRRQVQAVIEGDLYNHPAARAWASATSREAVPESVHVLREGSSRAVYRLPGLGADNTGVMAKRSLAPLVRIEQAVYEEVLPRLPLPSPRYYGTWFDEPYGWIFVEDAGDELYSMSQPEHLELAAEWVGALHVSAAGLAAARGLPDAGAARYLLHLQAGRQELLRSRRVWSFPAAELKVLMAAVALCEAIEARWSRLEAACDGLPSTLVHGDLRPKNVFLHETESGWILSPFDWETAGYGLPAADLTRIDLPTYWSVVRRAWPHVTFDTVEHLARIGEVFGWLAAIDWGSALLQLRHAADRSLAIERLDVLVDRLAAAGRSAGVLD